MSIKARPVKGTVRLNNNYNNVIKFNNAAEKFAYLESVEDGFQYFLGQSPDINFNIGDTVNTSIVMDYSKWGDDLNSALNRNYLVVADSNFPLLYYFYFIVGVTPLNRGTVRYDLELDVFTTYNINGDYEIDDFLVERAHQDRFTDESTAESAKFNFNDLAPAQAPDAAEEMFNSRYPKSIIDITYGKGLCETDQAHQMLNEIPGWLLCFVTGSTELRETGVRATTYRVDDSAMEVPYTIYFAPLSDVVQYKSDGRYYTWRARDLYENQRGGTADSQTSSFLIVKNLPFETGEWFSITRDLYYERDILLFNYDNYNSEEIQEAYYRQYEPCLLSGLNTMELVSFNFDTQTVLSDAIELSSLDLETMFSDLDKSDLRSASKEPKFLKKSMTPITLENTNGETYESGAFELGETFNIKGITTFNPECVTDFRTFYSETGYANKFYDNNIGKSSKQIIDLPIVNNAYFEFMRSNKNVLMTGLVIPTTQNVGSMIQNTAYGSVAGGVGAGLSTGSGVIGTLAGIANYHYEMDNLESTPDTVANFSNDFFFQMSKRGKMQDYIVVHELKDKEREMAFEYFYKYGYMVQERRNSNELFGRYIFNYVQSMDSTADKIITNVPMSNLIKNMIEATLNKGVTFWNYDSGKLFNYDYENYESRLFDTEEN